MSLSKKLLIAVLVFAAALRFLGITHGLPHIYNVDEPALVRSVMGLRFDLNPHHFDWPHFHFYFCYLFFVGLVKFRGLLQIVGLRGVLESVFPLFWRDPQIFYLEMRIISALMGTLTLVPIYLTGRKLFSKKVGLLAAAIYAAGPFIVENAHYALLDIPLTFWVAWVVYFSSLAYVKQSWRNYLLAGLFTGLAASTKYNGALSALSVFAASFAPYQKLKDCLKSRVPKLLGSGVVSVLAFVAGTPFLLLAADEAFAPKGSGKYHGRSLLWQLSRGGNHFDSGVFSRVKGTLPYLRSIVGFVPLLLAALSFFLLLKSDRARKVKLVFLLFFPVSYFLFFATGNYTVRHYFLPLAPSLAILAGFGLQQLNSFVDGYLGGVEVTLRRYLKFGLVALALLPSLYFSSYESYLLTQTDTRQLASDWVAKNIVEDAVIARKGEYQPVLDNVTTVPLREWKESWFDKNGIDYALLAGYHLSLGSLERYAGTDLQERLVLAKHIEPEHRPGPVILIYEYK